MVATLSKKSETTVTKSQLSERDSRLLLLLCTELITLCAKMTNKIDPTAAAMIAYVRDEIALANLLHR